MEALNEQYNALILTLGDGLWTWIVLPVLAVLGIYFTARSGVVQLRLLPDMFRVLRDKTPTDPATGRTQSVSSFQAFTISAASRVGVGNIAGVGTSIFVGGPGAVFWMWTMALFGAASAFIESTLAQVYKHRDEDGFRGGPAYYMQRGLGARWMGIAFAIVLIVCFPFAFSMLQANTIAATAASTVGDQPWLPWVCGVGVAVLTGLIVFGGVRRIASVTDKLVPVMALAYLLLGLAIVAIHVTEVPRVLGEIYAGAFGFQEIAGGALGVIIMQGVKRGMFSNEAGLGSAPNAGASAATTHPAKQGLVQSLGVYFDTFLVCSITAFIILVGTEDITAGERGIALTFDAVTGTLGAWSGPVLSVIVFMLAFSSIIGNYYYGESNIAFITKRRGAIVGYRILVVAAVLLGSVAATDAIWNTADTIMGVMALINLVAIAALSGVAFKVLKDYTDQRRAGLDPVFTRDRLPEVRGIEVWESVESVTGQLAVQPEASTDAAGAPRR